MKTGGAKRNAKAASKAGKKDKEAENGAKNKKADAVGSKRLKQSDSQTEKRAKINRENTLQSTLKFGSASPSKSKDGKFELLHADDR